VTEKNSVSPDATAQLYLVDYDNQKLVACAIEAVIETGSVIKAKEVLPIN